MSNKLIKKYQKDREELINKKLLIPAGKYVKTDYIKSRQGDVITKQDCINDGYTYLSLRKFNTEKELNTLTELIESGDSCRYVLKPHSRNNPDAKRVIRKGGFVNSVHFFDKQYPPYFTCKSPSKGASWIVRLQDISGIFLKRLGIRRKAKLQSFIEGIPYVDPVAKRKQERAEELKRKKEEKKQKGGEKYFQQEVEIPEDIKAALSNLYYNERNYVGRTKLYNLSVSRGIKATQRQVGKWLNQQEINQLYSNPKRKAVVKVMYPKKQGHVQADLVDVQPIAGKNHQKHYILFAIDLYTKYAWGIPVTDKSAEQMEKAFKRLIKQMRDTDRIPSILQTDNGSEFKVIEIETLLRENHIKHIFSKPYHSTSQGAIERFNQQFRAMFKKHNEIYHDDNWYDALPEFIKHYNDTKHNITKMKPKDLKEHNQEVTKRLFEEAKVRANYIGENEEFEIGDRVRIRINNKDTNRKIGHKKGPNWSREVYTIIKKVKPDLRYKNPLEATFYFVDRKPDKLYDHDLQKIDGDIEKIPDNLKKPDKINDDFYDDEDEEMERAVEDLLDVLHDEAEDDEEPAPAEHIAEAPAAPAPPPRRVIHRRPPRRREVEPVELDDEEDRLPIALRNHRRAAHRD